VGLAYSRELGIGGIGLASIPAPGSQRTQNEQLSVHSTSDVLGARDFALPNRGHAHRPCLTTDDGLRDSTLVARRRSRPPRFLPLAADALDCS
jgi:hypothetical protein